jgi:hypothetical protein
MAAETIIALALAMGRTLVLPPSAYLDHLGKDDNYKKTYDFTDFFPMEQIATEHSTGIDIISMEEYLLTEAMNGKLRHKQTGAILFPPGNRTNWNECTRSEFRTLKQYLRNVALIPQWTPNECIVYFPSSNSQTNVTHLTEYMERLHRNTSITTSTSFPIPVNSSTLDRLTEFAAGRQKVCQYDEWLQQQDYLHFECCDDRKAPRMLVHFYAFLFFEDWQEDLWVKRFIRDHGMLYLNLLLTKNLVTNYNSVMKGSGGPNDSHLSF